MNKAFAPTSLPAAEILEGVKKGGVAVVRTYARVTFVDAKVVAKFERVGSVVLKDEGVGGYRLGAGKSSVFLFPGQLQVNF